MSDAERPAWLQPDNRYKLIYPVTYKQGENDQILEELQLRRITLGDRVILDQQLPYAERLIQVLSNMSGQPAVIIRKIDAIDADRIDQIFGYFLRPGGATGATS